jgi:hypothetical protein
MLFGILGMRKCYGIIKLNIMEALLEIHWNKCLDEERSIEYTIVYLQDISGLTFEEVMGFINSK